MALGSGWYFLKKVFQNIKQWISVSVKVWFQELLLSFGGVGLSVAAVQLVPYVSFSHQFTFDPRNINGQKTAPRN